LRIPWIGEKGREEERKKRRIDGPPPVIEGSPFPPDTPLIKRGVSRFGR